MSKPKKRLIPIFKEISGDLDTPVSVYLKLNQKNSFLLESVTGGEQVARYSYIGIDPFCIFKNENGQNYLLRNKRKTLSQKNPIDELQSLVEEYEVATNPALPPLLGGAVGFFGWETIAHIEKVVLPKKEAALFPLAHFLLPRSLVIFDHAKSKIILLTLALASELPAAHQRLREMELCLRRPQALCPLEFDLISQQLPKDILSSYQRPAFEQAVDQVQRHIYAGDIFQLVLSQRFQVPSHKPPFEVYRTLRHINPSPYMFYFDFDDYQLIGSSPELLVKLHAGQAVLRPIAGTRPRDPKNEQRLMRELKKDEKEKAEHIMLVDLGRNDLGRVCEFKSIKIRSLMEIEKYSHVMHMVSEISGRLKSTENAFSLFKAVFPAGTVSGAPKIRAMELIEQLEPTRRGPYAGALGYFSFNGNMDLCIIIRTIFAQNQNFFVQAGAGIVADSDPATEFQETCNKAKGMLLACY